MLNRPGYGCHRQYEHPQDQVQTQQKFFLAKNPGFNLRQGVCLLTRRGYYLRLVARTQQSQPAHLRLQAPSQVGRNAGHTQKKQMLD